MQRLIDAEKLKEYKASGVSKLTDWQRGWSDAIDTIMGEAPTVEAIPIEWIKEWVNNYCDWSQEQLIEILLRTWNKKRIPTVGAEKHGYWIEHHEPYTWMGYTYWNCSECGFECGYEKDITFRTNYCPNCGADMREVTEDERSKTN